MNQNEKLSPIVVIIENSNCSILSLKQFVHRYKNSIRALLENSIVQVHKIVQFPIVLQLRTRNTNTVYFLLTIVFLGPITAISDFIEFFIRNRDFFRCTNWIYLIPSDKSRICVYNVVLCDHLKELLKIVRSVIFQSLNYRICFWKWSSKPLHSLKNILLGIPLKSIQIIGNIASIFSRIKQVIPVISEERYTIQNPQQELDNVSLIIFPDGIYKEYQDIFNIQHRNYKLMKSLN